MSPAPSALQMVMPFQGLQQALVHRSDRIRRGCMSDSVVVGPVIEGRFVVTVRWTNRDGSPGAHRITIAALSVFIVNGPLGAKLKKSPCRHADSIIQEVHKTRGR